MSETASVFKLNKSQAVRIPQPIKFPDDVKTVEVIKVGNARLLTPVGDSWESWFNGEGVSDDFMNEREQLADQERESL